MEHVSGAPRTAVGLRRPLRLLRLASDERLVALVREGDERAFEVLYDRHHRAILGFCRHMLGSREEAEDSLQQTFLSAYRDLLGSEKAIDLRPWLFAIARNRCLSILRGRREHAELELAEPSLDGLAATVERREELRELLGDLAGLPEDQRAALLLAELGALDHAGIAAVLGCPREKVKALVFQARSSLIADREARATPCEEIRLQLATASGGALRRGPLRRHVQNCAGCRAFKAEIAEQRRMLALALPVLPGAALKAGVLSGIGGGAAGGASGVAGAGLAGGGLGAIASGGAAKVAVSLTLAGAVAGGGALTLEARRGAPSGDPPAVDVSGPASRAPASTLAAPMPGSVGGLLVPSSPGGAAGRVAPGVAGGPPAPSPPAQGVSGGEQLARGHAPSHAGGPPPHANGGHGAPPAHAGGGSGSAQAPGRAAPGAAQGRQPSKAGRGTPRAGAPALPTPARGPPEAAPPATPPDRGAAPGSGAQGPPAGIGAPPADPPRGPPADPPRVLPGG